MAPRDTMLTAGISPGTCQEFFENERGKEGGFPIRTSDWLSEI